MYTHDTIPYHELMEFFEYAVDMLRLDTKHRQAKLLKYIEKYIKDNNDLPTIQHLFEVSKKKIKNNS